MDFVSFYYFRVKMRSDKVRSDRPFLIVSYVYLCITTTFRKVNSFFIDMDFIFYGVNNY